MIIGLTILLIVLIFAVVLAAMIRRHNMIVDEDEIVTHRTTVTTHTTPEPINIGLNVNGIPVVGILERQWDGSTPFVIDPVDNDKMFLNTKDDLYEDGAGKIWGLK